MKKKLPYEETEIEVLFFPTEDIVTASNFEENGDTSDDSWD